MGIINNEPKPPLRQLPEVILDDRDEELIKMVMVGTFLVTYRGARELLDTVDTATGAIDEISEVMDKVQESINNPVDTYRDFYRTTPIGKGLNKLGAGI